VDIFWWMMSTASWLATSPAAAPPMPSHTPKRAAAADELRPQSASMRPRVPREVGDEEVVLVVLAHLAHVGATEDAQADRTCGLRRRDLPVGLHLGKGLRRTFVGRGGGRRFGLRSLTHGVVGERT
jgi:hypothetical protein